MVNEDFSNLTVTDYNADDAGLFFLVPAQIQG